MQNPRRACPSLSWLHSRPTVGEDGVYREAMSPFGYFSLLLTEPFCRACLCLLLYALLLAFLLCLYAGAPAGAWLLFVRSASLHCQFFSRFLNPLTTLSSRFPHILPAIPSGEPAHTKEQLEWSRGSHIENSHSSLRSLIREALSSYPPTSAFSRCPFGFVFVEFITASLVLFFVFRSVRRVATGFPRSSLEAYSKRLIISGGTFSRQNASPSSATPLIDRPQQQILTQESRGARQQKADAAVTTEQLLEGQVAVVTGVTSGIGMQTAMQLAKWGAHVYFGARNTQQGRLVAAAINAEVSRGGAASSSAAVSLRPSETLKEAFLQSISFMRSKLLGTAPGNSRTATMMQIPLQQKEQLGKSSVSSTGDSFRPRVHVHELDLCRAASVREFAQWVLTETNGHVDILINNAGQMFVPELIPVTFDDGACFEYHNVCNHMGHFLLTQMLLPALKRSTAAAASSQKNSTSPAAAAVGAGGGRIINVASCAHVFHDTGFGILDVACTQETAAVAAAAIASGEAAREHQEVMDVQQQQQQLEKERRTADSLLRKRRRPDAKSYRPWRAYANSKLCNIWVTKELQSQLLASESATTTGDSSSTESSSRRLPGSTSSTGGGRKDPQEHGRRDSCAVGVYAAHPGVVATLLWRHFVGRGFLLNLITVIAGKLLMKTAADGAATTLFLCIAPKSVLHWGGYYADGSPSWVVSAALDRKAQRELWAASESACRLCNKAAPAPHNAPVSAK